MAWGTSSQSSSTRLAANPCRLTPVRLPPGRARLATRPIATGSPSVWKTTGIVEVACFAASAEASPPSVTITSTLRPTRSAAKAGSRSSGPPPSDIRSQRFVPRRSRFRSAPRGKRRASAEPGVVRRGGGEEADHRHRLLLRARRWWAPPATPASKTQKIAASHRPVPDRASGKPGTMAQQGHFSIGGMNGAFKVERQRRGGLFRRRPLR